MLLEKHIQSVSFGLQWSAPPYESAFFIKNSVMSFILNLKGHIIHKAFIIKPILTLQHSAEAVGFLRVNKNPQHVGGHGCLSAVIVVCCQVEVSATN